MDKETSRSEIDGGISVAEAALRLGLTPRRVHALIESGQLNARPVGDIWLVDVESIDQRLRQGAPGGRHFSPRRAWGLLFIADGLPTPWLDPVSRSKLKARLKVDSVGRLRPRLGARGLPAAYRAHPSDIGRIALEAGLMTTGGTAAAEFDLGLVDPGRLDAYATEERIVAITTTYGLQPSRQPNLILRALPDLGPSWSSPLIAPRSAVAIDLADDADPRLRALGERILEQY